MQATGRSISILIVNFNTGLWLRDCVSSACAVLPRGSFEVLVLDNASTDNSVAAAEQLALPVAWTRLTENVGFAAGNNLLFERATGDFVCLLNPDTVLLSDVLNPLVDYLVAHPDVAIVGPHHVGPDGGWQLSFGAEVNLRSEFLYAVNPTAFWGRFPAASPSSPVDVAWLAGSCILLPAALIRDTGLFDPRFFLNDEDIDLARRVRDRGLRVVYVPVKGLVHRGGVSRPFLVNETHHKFRSRWQYFRKHSRMPVQALFLVAHAMRMARDAASRLKPG